MQINVKYNVGEKMKRPRNCFATTSHSGSSTEQILRVERIIIERGNSFNVWGKKSTMSAKMSRMVILSHWMMKK